MDETALGSYPTAALVLTVCNIRALLLDIGFRAELQEIKMITDKGRKVYISNF